MIAAFRLKPISRVVLLCLFITSLAIAQTNMSSHPKTDFGEDCRYIARRAEVHYQRRDHPRLAFFTCRSI